MIHNSQFELQVVKSLTPKEYAEFLAERKLVVEKQLQELKELKESKMLRA
jgi:large subunit ribosomal protein L11